MGKSIYLIDYENVSYKGLYGISSVEPKDEIIIFYSNDISIIRDIIFIYEKSDITIKYYKLDKTGKNALDFMISAYAGYAVLQENISKIAIISNDKEYSSITTVIKSINPNVEMLFDCCIYNVIYPDNKKDIVAVIATPKVTEKNTAVSKPQVITKEMIKKDLQNKIPVKYIEQIAGTMIKSISNNNSAKQFEALIDKLLGKKESNAVYKNIAKQYFLKLKNRL